MDGHEESIRRRAYEIWEEEGRPEGRQDEHWARAAAEVAGLARPEAGQSTAATGRRDGVDGPVSPGATARGHMARARRKDAT
jgi:hypothetical protein